MLEYNILQNKKTTTKLSNYDGSTTVTYIDLLDTTYNRDSVIYGTPMLVTEPYVARPDLISFIAYKTDKYGDLICKLNGISNPFEMNIGDCIVVPPVGMISEYFTVKTNTALEGKIVATEQISNSLTSFQKKKNERRMPNESVVGEENYVVDKTLGLVFY